MSTQNQKRSQKPKEKPRRASPFGSPRAQRELFLRGLFPGDDPVIDVRVAKPDGPLKRTPCVGVEAAMEATALGVQASCSVYVGVASRADAGSGKGKGGKENLYKASALFMDVDFDEEVDQKSLDAKLASFPIEPSIRSQSGHGEHIYWLLEEPFALNTLPRIRRFELMLKGLVDHFGADISATDASRVMRVPGTTNFPDEKKRNRGRSEERCRLRLFEPKRKYAFDDFKRFRRQEGRVKLADGPTENYAQADWDGKLPKAVGTLIKAEGKLKKRWKGDTTGLNDKTESALDMSIANLLANELLPTMDRDQVGQIIEASLRYRRTAAGSSRKHDTYFPKTVGRALASAQQTDDRLEPGSNATVSVSGTQKGKPQIKKLTEIASSANLFRSPSRTAYATIPLSKNVKATVRINSPEFRAWCSGEFARREGRPPQRSILRDAIEYLSDQTKMHGRIKQVFLRTGQRGDDLYLDLGDEDRRAIHVTTRGWKVVRKPNLKFERTQLMAALPRPVRGGNLKRLRRLLNLRSDEDWTLLLGWVIASLRSKGPYPILMLRGEQGSAKSMTTRILRRLVDPNESPVRSIPRSVEDLAVAARNSWVIAFDNVSGFRPELSDALCGLSTGGGFGTRRFYTNAEEVVLDACRPIIINGIGDASSRPDLLERAIVIDLPSIKGVKRRTEEEIWEKFDRMHPKIFGVLCDALVCATANSGSISLPEKPRMADAVIWISAAESALGLKKGSFFKAFQKNAQQVALLPLDSSLIVAPLEALLKSKRGEWRGTMTELLEKLRPLASDTMVPPRGFPTTASYLSGQLRQLRPSLRLIGIRISFDRSSGGIRREVWIRRQRKNRIAS